jgi:immunity protein 74 of polymorphic toxin system
MEGRDAFRYCEGDHCALIGAELLTGPIDRVVDAGALTHWLPPHDKEEIPPDKRVEIINMLSAYFAKRGTKFEVDWHRT